MSDDGYVRGLDPLPGGEVPRPAENPDHPFRNKPEMAPVIPVESEARCRDALERMRLLAKGNGASPTAIEQILAALNAQGTGQERVIPATDLRAWIEANLSSVRACPGWEKEPSWKGWDAALIAVSAWLDEHTVETPS